MNARVFLNFVSIFAIMVALTGCVAVEIISSDEARESEVVVQGPTETPIALVSTERIATDPVKSQSPTENFPRGFTN